MKNIFYCLMIITLSSCGRYINNSENKTDKIFINWNIATANSMQLQEKSINDEYQKSLYKNRLEAFKSYIDVGDLNQLNKNSIRYKLLNQYLNDWDDKFYIVEANESGEIATKISYIILQNGTGTSKVLKYIYRNGKWEKAKEYAVSSSFKFDRESYNTKFGEGKNENDITVTYAENSTIISSDFFLLLSMKQIEILKDK
ncbi:hypothetical protein EV143_11725 [Flavobacterium chryseum]|uniref:Lipoprotein n=4 Tax=Flavobacterium TaxID=237 RepID=A0A941AY09_9FLAO|nr:MULTISPECIES: hypothetical protein [Flavobacterium]MBP4139795.1 hypothetical protein [Flavobacterium geliluteum]TCN49914.1 hypothetical protein EV142_1199 [Flavobacterium circumlabens]TDO68882.1 hypothetical protein EV143_11725 [Flavobacterium sp. P3160]